MEAIFNELSLSPLFTTKQDANFAIQGLLKTFKEAKEYGFKAIRVEMNDFADLFFVQNYTLRDWLNDSETNKTEKNFLMSIFKYPFKEEQADTYISKPNWYIEQQNAIGLAVAFYQNTLAISLLDEKRLEWDKYVILIYNEKGETGLVKHAARPEHSNTHQVSFVKPLTNWQPTFHHLFPNTRKDINYAWEKDSSDGNRNDMIAATRSNGRKLAEANNWKRNNYISSLNSTPNTIRDIYEAGTGRNRMFLSIDVEKYGCWEVYDSRGKHLGEVNFKGEQTKKADNTGKHDIKIEG